MKPRPESKNSRWRLKLTRCFTLLRTPRKFITVFVEKCTIINYYWKGRSLGFCYVLLTSKAGLSILPHVVQFFNTQKRNLLCLLHTYKMNAFTFECLETHRNEPLRSIFEIKKQMFQGFFFRCLVGYNVTRVTFWQKIPTMIPKSFAQYHHCNMGVLLPCYIFKFANPSSGLWLSNTTSYWWCH